METLDHRELNQGTDTAQRRPANDNRRDAPAPASRRSSFPDGTLARIFQPARSAMTSGKARAGLWHLAFERRSAPWVEPLMGWTSGDDPLTQIQLSFPTLEAAISYARRQGLAYAVQPPPRTRRGTAARRARALSDTILDRLGLAALRESYGHAFAEAANMNEASRARHWASPWDVVHAAGLSVEARRSILTDWAWTEYLIDQATNEGMPENGRPSRLDEVDQALLALERQGAPLLSREPLAHQAA